MKKREKPEYSETLCCFDIETSKDVIDGENAVWCWSWQVLVGNAYSSDEDVYITPSGWCDFWDTIFGLQSKEPNKRLIIFVHNLGHEFEFLIRNSGEHELTDLFAKDTHAPLYAVFDDKIEFRCSYFLTNKSLAECAKDVGLAKSKDFDYSIVRYPDYICTNEENHYREFDVRILAAKIRQLQVQEEMMFWKFPLTNTAFLRNELRAQMSKDKSNRIWFNTMRMEYYQYILCRDAFMGGYTHSNYTKTGYVINDVDSFDFGSAYPFAMLVHKYPCGKWHRLRCKISTLKKMLLDDSKLFICKIALKNIKSVGPNTFLSYSKSKVSKDVVVDNGRIYKASYVETTLTSIDLDILLKAYTIDAVAVLDCIWCECDYLPDVILKLMLKYYEMKQNLKDVNGEELNYMKAKNRVNSYYGMFVQNPLNDETTIEDGTLNWKRTKIDYTDKNLVSTMLNDYYKNWSSFLPYQIGIFVPAYTRLHLWHFILAHQDNVVYNDTDSCKFCDLNDDIFKTVDAYNEWARSTVKARLKELGIEKDFPDLGVFDWETSPRKKGIYVKFKTLGAKKYMYEDIKGIRHITVSGLSKSASQYIQDFDDFSPGVTFDEDVSGRTVSKCITNVVNAPDNGGLAIYNTTYTLNVTDLYFTILGCPDEQTFFIGKNGRYYDDSKRQKIRKQYDIDIDMIYRKNTLLEAREVFK